MIHHKKIISEKETLSLMITTFCQKKHSTEGHLCDACAALENYAHERLEKCPWGEEKPSCRKCTIHCYSPEKREAIRKVMRFSGPRILFIYPIKFFKHYFPSFGNN